MSIGESTFKEMSPWKMQRQRSSHTRAAKGHRHAHKRTDIEGQRRDGEGRKEREGNKEQERMGEVLSRLDAHTNLPRSTPSPFTQL